MSLDDAALLAVAAIYISSETKEGIEHIKDVKSFWRRWCF